MQTRSHADRFSAPGRCKTRRILQYSRTAKYDFAVKRVYTAGSAKFRFKFIRRYVANFIKFMRTTINSVLKFYVAEYCKHSLAKHTANAVALRNMPARQNTARQTAVAQLATHRFFGVRHGYSHCKSAAANDCNTPLLAFSARPTSHSCTRARQANTPTVSPARATINASYRQGAI